jgi:uncharacterized protein YyaL (SSP411 family)
MARGGMYDQLAGGFHRYSVDDLWLVPHFEKMLYDNALLARVYLEAFQITGEAFYERITREILDYVLREMTSEEGGFYSATDADSEGEEGKFFVWTPAEVAAALDHDEAELFCQFYDVREGGNWEGRSILHVALPEEEFAAAAGIDRHELESRLAAARESLRERRAQRVAPFLDDKIITAWNAMMLGSFARAHRVLGDARYRQAAESAAHLLLGELRDGERLLRTRRAGRSKLPAYLEDHGYLADALIDLYEATFEPMWIERAGEIVEIMNRHFWDEQQGGYFFTADDHEALLTRNKLSYDGAMPSGTSMAVMALTRLGRLNGDGRLEERARRVVAGMAPLLEQSPGGFGQLLQGVELLARPSREVVIVGPRDGEATRALIDVVARRYLPDAVTACVSSGAETATVAVMPPVAGKEMIDGRPAAYVCRDRACRAPVVEPADLAAELDAAD